MLNGRIGLAIALMALAGCPSTPMSGGDASETGTGTETGTSDIVNGTDVTGRPDVASSDSMDSGTVGDAAACGLGGGYCNPVTNAGCPTGQACVLVGEPDGGTGGQCAPPGTGGYGTTCSSANGCLEGFACLGSVSGGASMCVKLCCGMGDNNSCRNGTGGMHGAVCAIQIEGLPFWGCQSVSVCDWFAQDCGAGQQCVPIDSMGSTTCVPAGTGTAGAQCQGTGDAGFVNCAAGYTCIQSTMNPNNGFCRQVCDPTLNGADAGPTPDGGVSRACPTGITCDGLSGDIPNNYGVCVPPGQ